MNSERFFSKFSIIAVQLVFTLVVNLTYLDKNKLTSGGVMGILYPSV